MYYNCYRTISQELPYFKIADRYNIIAKLVC